VGPPLFSTRRGWKARFGDHQTRGFLLFLGTILPVQAHRKGRAFGPGPRAASGCLLGKTIKPFQRFAIPSVLGGGFKPTGGRSRPFCPSLQMVPRSNTEKYLDCCSSAGRFGATAGIHGAGGKKNQKAYQCSQKAYKGIVGWCRRSCGFRGGM